MRRWLEPLCLVAVLAAQVALFTRLLRTSYDFDEGVYLLALDALRSGQELGTQVFAAQPPVFYALLRGIAFLLGDDPGRIRLGVALLSIAGTVGAWAVARAAAGPVAGVLAAALIVISPPVPLFAARVLSDLPSLWVSLAALATAAVAARKRWHDAAAGAAGVLLALAVGTKASAVLATPAVTVVLAARSSRPRRATGTALGAAVATGIGVAAVHAGSLGQLWDSAVRYHRDARNSPPVIDRWASIGDLFNPRTPAFWLALAGGAALCVRIVRRRVTVIEAVAWGWAGLGFALLATHSPLHYNHLVALPVPLALASAISLGAATVDLGPKRRRLAAGLIVVTIVAGFAQQWRRLADANEAQSPIELAAAAALADRTTPTSLVASDLPVAAVLAQRLVPGPIVDTAFLRFRTGSLTADAVLSTIDDWCVEAVVVGRSFAREPLVLAGLRERFQDRSPLPGGAVYSHRAQRCTPTVSTRR